MTDPERIHDYDVVGVLGRGGMGVVYQAVHAPSGAHAAVKTVRVPTESTIDSIRREIHMLRLLRHPGVVSIIDHGISDGMPWYAMDLLRGRTLRDDLRAWFPEPTHRAGDTRDLKAPTRARVADHDGPGAAAAASPPYSVAHVATVFRKLCEPLAYVHGQGVIHRDLSPANIFLVGPDQPVLFDFGLASKRSHPSEIAREVLEVGGTTRGTAHYMAPEQARGEVVDARADVYALGCILFEALTGRPPFLGDSALAVLMQHITDPPRAPSAYVRGIPPPLDDLVVRMLAKSARDRIGYVEDVAAALDRIGAPGVAGVAVAGARARAYTYRPGLAGRTDLLGALDQSMLRLLGDGARVRGRGGCAVLLGESGVGKTRLAAEIATRAAEQGIRVVTGECEPFAAPLHALRPVLRLAVDACREGGRAEIDRLLGPWGALLAAYEPALAAYASTSIDSADSVPTPGARFRVLAVLRDLLAALASDEPTLLVLDDVQWADELTLAFLASATELLATTPVFVLATARTDEMTPELDAALATLGAARYPVPRLDREAVGAMVRDMLALDDDAPSLTDFVASRSAGNPLFAAEYVRIAVDEGVLQRDVSGRWRLSDRSGSYDRLPTPGSVRALVQQRLRGLSDGAREVAFAAAVLGRPSDAATLARAAELDESSARHAVTELIQRHVVEELAGGELQLVHDTLREQAYGELEGEDRARRHRRAALAIEGNRGADFTLRYAELAHHHEAGGALAHAVDYLELAAEHALRTAAYGDARALLRRLVALGSSMPATRRARWERWLGEACYTLGDLEGCRAHTQRALDQLGHELPRTTLGWAATIARGLGGQLWSRGGFLPRGRAQRLELAEAALASARMSSCYFFDDDSLGLVGASLAAVNLAERAGDGVAVAEIYAQLGYVAGLAKLGGVARAYFARARVTAKATRDRVGLGKVLFTEAAWHVGVGAWEPARAAATEGLAIARELRDPQEAEVALTILGHVAFATGDYAASRRLAVELYDSARARANAQHEAWGVYTQARASLYVGDLDDAIAGFDRAMGLLVGQADKASMILCGGMLASALARAGQVDRARDVADATTERIGDRTPPVFTISEGFIGAADAYLELWRRTADASLARPAKLAIANLARLARVFPIASPAAASLAGVYQLRAGSPRRAAKLLARGLALAERLHMPHDQAVAHRGLAELAGC